MNGDVYILAGGEVSIWLDEGGAVMLKLSSASKDPIELGEGEVFELIEILTKIHAELIK